MSLFSVVNVVFVVFILPCIFFFHPIILLLLLCAWLVVFIKLVGYDVGVLKVGPNIGFWLFILSEIIVFMSLLVTCLWFQDLGSVSLSYVYSVPLVETVLLVSSSFFISAYHCLASSSKGFIYLVLSLISAYVFMMLAIYEVIVSDVSSLFNPHAASCYLVLGLHFSHVLLGSLLLIQLVMFTFSDFVRSSSDVYIIYWHFVDYIWLFVFTVVYLIV